MEQLGKYTLLERIGVGGMAEVWLARASGPGGFAKSCVVKMVRAGVDQDRFSRMFMDEARLAALLNHPNIVQLFDFGEHEGRLFIAMEFIQGRTLRALMKKCAERGTRLPLDHTARIMSGVLEGLEHAHSLTDEAGQPLKVIHRDVSPENIMVGYSGVPKLVDFGIAKAVLSTDRTRDGRAKGKLTYMAPEQLLGHPLDHRVDIYACGVVLYELVCQRHPFPIQNPEALARAIIEQEPTPPHQVDPSLPDELVDIIERCMQKDPDRRFLSARDLSSTLNGFLETLTVGNNAPRLDQLISTLWAEEMSEDAARARKAAGAAAASQPNVHRNSLSALIGDDERDTVNEISPLASPSSSRMASTPPSQSPRATSGKISSTRLPSTPPSSGGRTPSANLAGARASLAPIRAEAPAPMPPPPVPTAENALSTSDRNALAQVFATDAGTAALPPPPPPPPETETSNPRASFLPAEPPPLMSDGFGVSTVHLRGNTWQAPRKVVLSAMVTAAIGSGAISGALFYVVGVHEGEARVSAPPARIQVSQPGCTVKVSGKDVGATPLIVDVVPGDHPVELTCGEERLSNRVSVRAGEQWTLMPLSRPVPEPPPDRRRRR